MEGNPCEAVKNNVTGTKMVAQDAEEHRVTHFIFVSTDKAVRPTSVMGATKRVTELLLQVRAKRSRTSFYSPKGPCYRSFSSRAARSWKDVFVVHSKQPRASPNTSEARRP